MKRSNYIYFVHTGKGVVGFNTFTNSFVYLNRNIYHTYFEEGNDFSQLDSLFPVQYQQLLNRGFVIPEELDEYSMLLDEAQNDISNPAFFDLTLLPSLDCNLRCWYCYEKHITGSHLSQRIVQSIFLYVKRIFEKTPKVQFLQITMFGGEPLLYFKEELYPLLDQIKQYVESLGKYVSFFFVTNAVYIDDESIPLFKNLNASFQVSIDGYKEKHDKIKFIPGNHFGTYDQVISTIKNLTRQLDDVYINLRVNYDDQSLVQIDQLIEDLMTVDRKKIGIHLERVWQTSNSISRNNVQLKDAIRLLIANGFVVSYMNMSRRSHACKSSMENQCVISYDGKVYKCTGRDFTDDTSEGTLQPDGSIVWNSKKLSQRMQICTFDNELCRQCTFLPVCWGPCNQKLLESGSTEETIRHYCQLNLMEMSLDDYVLYRFNNEIQWNKNHENTQNS